MDENNSNSKMKYYLGGLVVVVIAAIAFYFLYWVKTPSYSLGIIKSSIEKHDLVKFEQHVDLNSLYGRAFDSYMGSELKGEDNAFVLGIVKAFRGVVLDELINQTKRYVETGKFEAESKPKAQGENKDNPFNLDGAKAVKEFGDRTGAQGMDYKGVESTEKEGKIAVVNVKMFDNQLQRDFIWKIKMRELDNSEWQIVEFSNFADFMKEHDQAIKDKLVEINKPVTEKMAQYIKVSDNVVGRLDSTNPFFRSDDLFYTLGIVLPDNSNKVKEFYGTLTVKDANGQQVMEVPTHFVDVDKNYDKPDYSATMEYSITAKRNEPLNPFIAKENNIMNSGIEAYKLSFVVTKLVMVDGTNIELATKLPETKGSK